MTDLPIYRHALILSLFLSLTTALANEPDPLTLSEIQAFAVEHAPGLERQRLGYTNLVAAVEIAKARFDPVVNASREWRESTDTHRTEGSVRQIFPADLDARASATLQETPGGEDITTYALTLSKTLIGGGSLLESRLPVNRARVAEAKEWNRLSLEQRRLRLTVTRQYFEVVRNQQTLRLRELQLERARLNLEHALVREDPLDIATARLRIPESELDVLTAQRAIHNGLLALKAEIGFPLQEPLTLDTEIPFHLRTIDLDEDLLTALGNHEAILNAQLDIQIAREELRVARTRRFPEVEARLNLQTRDDPSSAERETDTRGEVVMTWPLGQRRDRAEMVRRESDLRSSEIALHQAETDRRRDVESLALRVEEAARTVAIQEERVDVLEQQLRLFQDRWDNGEIGILEYIRSQNNLEDARVQYVAQQLRYLELLAEYDFNVGR